MEYIYIGRVGDKETIADKVKEFESSSNENLIEEYNKQSKCGITGVRGQALYLMAMGHVFFKRFGKSPIYMENNVLGMKEQIKLSGDTFEDFDKLADKLLVTKSSEILPKKNFHEELIIEGTNTNTKLTNDSTKEKDKPIPVKLSEIFPKRDFHEELIIEGTNSAPRMTCDSTHGIIEIKGRWTLDMRSTPHVDESFKPLLDWLDQYTKTPSKQTKVTIQFEYFSTCCSICLLDVLKKFETIYKQNNPVVIYWYYEEGDKDMLEQAEDFESIVRVPFKIIPYKV